MRFSWFLTFYLLVSPAFGGQEVIRDKNGNMRGTITHEGSRDVYRDQNGNAQGYSQRQGDTTVFRDKNGNREYTIQKR